MKVTIYTNSHPNQKKAEMHRQKNSHRDNDRIFQSFRKCWQLLLLPDRQQGIVGYAYLEEQVFASHFFQL